MAGIVGSTSNGGVLHPSSALGATAATSAPGLAGPGTPTIGGGANNAAGSGASNIGGGAGNPVGMDGGSGAAGGSTGGAGKAVSKVNTNILSGEGGGGGGGGGSFGGGSGSSRDALRQYLPGGKRDPAQIAAQAVSKEVTSQGGKSNWEKITDRYRDNKPSLLGY